MRTAPGHAAREKRRDMQNSENTQAGPSTGETIRRAAFKLLMEQGYAKTSYSSIAAATGQSRSLVQYYYPKKERLLTEFTLSLLELAERYMDENGLRTGLCFTDFSISGYMYFYFLLENEQLRPLAHDIMANRATSCAVNEVLVQWQGRSEELAAYSPERIAEGVLLAMGGAYEIINHHLEHGLAIDIPTLLCSAISAYMHHLGLDTASYEASFGGYLLSDSEVAAANLYIMQHLLAG